MFKSVFMGVVLALSLATAAPAQSTPNTDGDWIGTVSAPGAALRIALHLGATATFDSLDQGALGLPAEAIVKSGHLIIEADSVGAIFDLIVSPDGQSLTGVLQQGGQSIPAEFHRGAVAALNRPQTPKPPFPYRSEDVSYPNPKAPGVTLAGTLTLPQGKGPFPVALLITGSGVQDRDETIFEHKPFLVIADALTRRGVAVLRVDDRGAGGTTGASASDTSGDFATDVEAGVAWLKKRTDIDPRRIGLIGHSDGGSTAVAVAAHDRAIAFVVLLAGPGVRGAEALAEQNRLVDLARGLPKAVADQDFANKTRLFQAVADAPDEPSAKAAAAKVIASIGAPPDQAAKLLATVTSPFFRYLLAYDPAPDIRAIKAPVLALDGTKDVEVSAAQNLPAIKAADPQAETVEIPSLNHLFQTAHTGDAAEYATIEETFSPVALKIVTDWTARAVGLP